MTTDSPTRLVLVELTRQALRRNRLVLAYAVISLVLIAIMIASGRRESALSVLSGLGVLAPIVAAMLTVGGIVADDRDSGVIQLWFQKRGSLVRTYSTVFGMKLMLLVAFVLSIAFLVALIAIPTGLIDGRKAVHLFLAMLGFCLVPATIVFAMSAWRVKRDSTVAFLVMFASLMLGVSVVFEETLYARVVRAIVFPIDPLQVIGKTGPYLAADAKAFGIVTGQIVAWAVIGQLGLHVLQRAMARGRT